MTDLPHAPQLGPDQEPCAGCRTPLAADQRYCLACGRRRGPARLDFLALLPGTAPRAPAPAAVRPTSALLARARPAVPLALAAAVGLLVGSAGPRAPETYAGGADGLTVVLPAPPPASAPPATSAPAAPPPAPEPPAVPEPSPELPVEPDPVAVPAATPDDPSPTESPAASPPGTEPEDGPPPLPAVRHVWVVALDGQSADRTYDPGSPAAWLSRELPAQGVLLPNLHGVAPGAPAGGVALIAGQGPNPALAAGCPAPVGDLTPATIGADGQELGDGCRFSPVTGTLADQLRGTGLDWRAYAPGVDPAAPCTPGTTRIPLLLFRTVTDDAGCAERVGDLPRLLRDLRTTKAADAPALTWIAAGPCDDGSDVPCAEGAPAGLLPAEQLVRTTVEAIQRTRAYREAGLILVTSTSGRPDDPTGCCFAPAFPNLPGAPAGGRVGGVLLSPLLPAGKIDETPLNHFDVLRSLSELFGLRPLGYADRPEVTGLPLAALAAERSTSSAGRSASARIPPAKDSAE